MILEEAIEIIEEIITPTPVYRTKNRCRACKADKERVS
jgi:hypothetical protein